MHQARQPAQDHRRSKPGGDGQVFAIGLADLVRMFSERDGHGRVLLFDHLKHAAEAAKTDCK